tara:strand:+ start:1235 stop:2155 length:921 start_codon:yes stop_codon:yes gene_type:complete
MDLNFFKKIRILDGGMGQELLARGLISRGTLWSAGALIKKKYHKLIIDTHLSFINAGADVILTNTFTTRRIRMKQNKVNYLFKYVNKKACELAMKAKKISKKKIFIGGSLPAQNNTYEVDKRDKKIIKKNFYEQSKIIYPYIDFFYLDVISSGREIKIALDVINNFNKPVLIGIHIKKNGKLPSGETITEIVKKYQNNKWLGIILACVSLENIKLAISELKKLNLPYGFKANLWKIEDPLPVRKFNPAKFNEIGKNPNLILGKRDEITGKIFAKFSKKIIGEGATIVGGCCETNASHIKEIVKLKY